MHGHNFRIANTRSGEDSTRNHFCSSFKAQRCHGTHARGAPGGYPDCQERDGRQQDRRREEGGWIQRFDSEEEAGEKAR